MPVDRGVIEAQLREIGEGDRWWEQREFRSLPHVLHADESIRGLAAGRLLGLRRPRFRPASGWLIVATDRRLICLRQGRVARRQVDIAAEEIVRIHQSRGIRAAHVTVTTQQSRYRIAIAKADAYRFAAGLAPLVRGRPGRTSVPDLGPWGWIPGLTAVASLPGVAGIVSKTLLRPAPERATREHVERLEATVDRLQEDVDRMREQVTFLEDLLHKRADEMFLPQ